MNLRRLTFLRSLDSIVMLAVFLQALIPAGFMPDWQNDDGTTTIVICTAQGLQQIKVNFDDDAPAPHDDTQHQMHETCPYAPVLTQHVQYHAPVPLYILEQQNPPVLAHKDQITDSFITVYYNSQAPPHFI